jgi:uncharacterized protein YdeI (YjbR/CyaY-like superfamily)
MIVRDLDTFLRDGCGRCERFASDDCNARRWAAPIAAMRALLAGTALVEEMKWGSPCYAIDGRNVASLSSRNDGCVLGFFQGAALDDPRVLLRAPGPNTRTARVLVVTSADEVRDLAPALLALIDQAIHNARTGVRSPPPSEPEPVPEELEERLATDARLRDAFDALTPGRKRSHILHIQGAKQRETRERRVEKCAPKILAGLGFNER